MVVLPERDAHRFLLCPAVAQGKSPDGHGVAQLRYSGRPAIFFRAFRAVYPAIPINTIIMDWVNLATAEVLALTLGLTTTRQQMTAVFVCLALTLAHNAF